MKILLVDADSTIPNLALMKLSKFHKNKGDIVELQKLNIPYYPDQTRRSFYIDSKDYDKIYCSIIFDGSKNFINGKNIEYGGTGFDLSITLLEHIENLQPDYSIYPNNKISYGFISRGCIRKCSFCKVPKKEGMIRQVNTIDQIVQHKQVKFLDNNFLALPNHKELLKELIDKNINCQFNQGLDIRLVDEENSSLLSQLNYLGNYIFAFDDISYLPLIEEKIKILSWKKSWQFKFFVYIHPNMEIKNIVDRINWLKDNECLPYIMRDITCWKSIYNEFYIDLAAYCNQVNLFKKMNFSEFLEARHTNKSRIKQSRNLFNSYHSTILNNNSTLQNIIE